MGGTARSMLISLALLLGFARSAMISDEHLSRSILAADASGHHRLISLQRAKIDTREVSPISAANLRSAAGDNEPALYLVQVKPGLNDRQRSDIERRAGIKLGFYVPSNAYTVWASAAKAAVLLSDSAVVWVGPYLPEYKLSEDVFRHVTADSDLCEKVDCRVLDLLLAPTERHAKHPNADKIAKDIVKALLGAGIGAKMNVGTDVIRCHLSTPLTQAIADIITNFREIYHVDFNLPVETHNQYQQLLGQSGSPSQNTGTRPYWDAGLRGQNQIAALTDSGIDLTNCFFYDPNGLPPPLGTNTNHRKIVYYEPKFGDTRDVSAHGTHTSGSVAGFVSTEYYTLNAQHVALNQGYSGNAPDAKIYFQDAIYGSNSSLSVPQDYNTDLFPPPYAAGARVHSNSWGLTTASSNAYTLPANKIDTFISNHPDYTIVFSAGNSGESQPSYNQVRGQAVAKNDIVVGASRTSNDGFVASVDYLGLPPDQLAAYRSAFASDSTRNEHSLGSFSSRGPTADSRIKPDVVFVGDYVTSARASSQATNSPSDQPHCDPNSIYGGNNAAALYATFGTSMAAPGVAGLAILVRQYFMEGFYPTGARVSANALAPSAALVKAALINSAVPLTGQVDLYNSGKIWVTLGAIPSIFQGFGRPQLDQALYLSGVTSRKLFVSDSLSVSTGEFVDFCLTTDGTAPLKVTLVWTDRPADVNAALALVNDLDLIVGEDNNVQMGNWGDKADVLNNVEQVTLTPLASHTYKIRVLGRAVNQGPQTFALVVSGDFAPSSVTNNPQTCVLSYSQTFTNAGNTEVNPYPSPTVGSECGLALQLGTTPGCVTDTMATYEAKSCSGAPAQTTKGKWFRYPVSVAGSLTISTCNAPAVGLDTVIEVYKGSNVYSACASTATCLAWADDSAACTANTKASTLTLSSVVPGDLIYILVRAKGTAAWGTNNPFTLCFTGTAVASTTPSRTPSRSVTPVSLSMTSSVTPTISVSASRTATRSPTSTRTPSVSISSTRTPTRTPSATPSRTSAPSVTASPSFSASASKTSSKSVTASKTPTISVSASRSPSLSITSSRSPSASNSTSSTPTASFTASRTASPSQTATSSATQTPSVSPSVSQTATSSRTATISLTSAPSVTPSSSETQSPSVTSAPSVSASSSETSAPSASSTPSETSLPSQSSSPSETPVASVSPAPSLSPVASPEPNPWTLIGADAVIDDPNCATVFAEYGTQLTVATCERACEESFYGECNAVSFSEEMNPYNMPMCVAWLCSSLPPAVSSSEGWNAYMFTSSR